VLTLHAIGMALVVHRDDVRHVSSALHSLYRCAPSVILSHRMDQVAINLVSGRCCSVQLQRLPANTAFITKIVLLWPLLSASLAAWTPAR
jgi:hypothetical protein